jgi:hypothetical protein
MKKVALALITAAFAATAMAGPVLAQKKKKAAPGKCGTMMYYDKKKKSCASKG